MAGSNSPGRIRKAPSQQTFFPLHVLRVLEECGGIVHEWALLVSLTPSGLCLSSQQIVFVEKFCNPNRHCCFSPNRAFLGHYMFLGLADPTRCWLSIPVFDSLPPVPEIGERGRSAWGEVGNSVIVQRHWGYCGPSIVPYTNDRSPGAIDNCPGTTICTGDDLSRADGDHN